MFRVGFIATQATFVILCLLFTGGVGALGGFDYSVDPVWGISIISALSSVVFSFACWKYAKLKEVTADEILGLDNAYDYVSKRLDGMESARDKAWKQLESRRNIEKRLSSEFKYDKHVLDNCKTIINDSVSNVTTDFSGFRGELEVIVNKITDLVSGLDDVNTGVSVRGYSSEVAEVLKALVEALGKLSSRNDMVTAKNREMSLCIDNVFSVLSDVKKIANKTNLLALNAAIEASKAGAFGKGFGVVADEVRALSESSKKLNMEITRSATQVKGMMSEVGALLDASAKEGHQIYEKYSLHSDEINNRMLVVNGKINEVLDTVAGSLNVVSEKVDESTRLLQFDDMVGQKLVKLKQRLDVFGECLDSWGGPDAGDYFARLNSIRSLDTGSMLNSGRDVEIF